MGCGSPANVSAAGYDGSMGAPASVPGAWDRQADHEGLASWATGGDVASTAGRRSKRPSGQRVRQREVLIRGELADLVYRSCGDGNGCGRGRRQRRCLVELLLGCGRGSRDES